MDSMDNNKIFDECMYKVNSYESINNTKITFNKIFEIFTEPYRTKLLNIESEHKAEIEKLNQELETLKNANKKVKSKKVKQGIKLTKYQIEFIKELTEKYGSPRDKILKLFNEKYNLKEPLTISQLRKVMKDNDIIKPKKCVNTEIEKIKVFD